MKDGVSEVDAGSSSSTSTSTSSHLFTLRFLPAISSLSNKGLAFSRSFGSRRGDMPGPRYVTLRAELGAGAVPMENADPGVEGKAVVGRRGVVGRPGVASPALHPPVCAGWLVSARICRARPSITCRSLPLPSRYARRALYDGVDCSFTADGLRLGVANMLGGRLLWAWGVCWACCNRGMEGDGRSGFSSERSNNPHADLEDLRLTLINHVNSRIAPCESSRQKSACFAAKFGHDPQSRVLYAPQRLPTRRHLGPSLSTEARRSTRLQTQTQICHPRRRCEKWSSVEMKIQS